MNDKFRQKCMNNFSNEEEEKSSSGEIRINEIFNNLKEVVWSMSWPDLKVQFISKAIQKIIGYSRKNIKGNQKFILKITHPDDRYIHEKTLKKLILLQNRW